MRSGRAATCYYAAGRGPADPNVHIADIGPEQVRNGRLYEGVPAVVGTGDMRSAGLPGDPHGAIGSIHRNGRLGRLVSELGDTCRVKLVVSAANACSDSSRVDGAGKRYTVAMTAAASRMGALRKEMATMPSGGLARFNRFASSSTAELQIVSIRVP